MLKRIGGTTEKDIYIGSTSQNTQSRLKNHQYCALHLKERGCENNILLNRMLEVGVDKWEVIPLQVTETDRNTARAFELAWYNFYKPDLNSQVPFRLGYINQEKNANTRNLNIVKKKYYCGLCGHAFCGKQELKRHTISKNTLKNIENYT